MQLVMKLMGPLVVVLCAQCVAYGGNLLGGFDVSGDVKNFRRSTSASGVKLQIDFRKIAYDGRVKAISIRGSKHGLRVSETNGSESECPFELRMEMDAVRFTIGETEISSWLPVSAECGPMKIKLGTKRNVVVTFRAQKSNDGVEILETKLKLEDDNWEIGSPEHIQTSGFGMTENRVVNGLSKGLREKVEAIEKIMRDEAKKIISKVQDKLLVKLEAKGEGEGEVARKLGDHITKPKRAIEPTPIRSQLAANLRR